MSTTPERLRALEPLWGTWYIDETLGEGSFGKVYKLHRSELGTEYVAALKWISLPLTPGDVDTMRSEGLTEEQVYHYFDGMLRTFNDEIRLMTSLRGHSNIVSYEDHMIHQRVGEIGWDILIRMELLTSLDKRVMKGGFSETDAAIMGRDICRALEICDRHKIIHRDIKPDNIFISGDENCKLGDFGVARTMEHTIDNMSRKGTPVYMSPEVYFNKPTDRRADTYSLGLVMYRILNKNRMPFLTTTGIPTHVDRENAFNRRIQGEMLPPPCNGSDELKRIVLKAASFNQESRYASAAEMEAELQRLIDSGTLSHESLFTGVSHNENQLKSGRSDLITNPMPTAGTASQTVPLAESTSGIRHSISVTESIAPGAARQPAVGAPPQQYNETMPLESAAPQYRSGEPEPRPQSQPRHVSPPPRRQPPQPQPAAAQPRQRNGARVAGITALVVVGLAIAAACLYFFIMPKYITIGTQRIAVNATEIDLSDSDIYDITALSECVNLQKVDLSGNNLVDIKSLSGLMQLDSVDISGNYIADISPLVGHTKLAELNATQNNLTDVSALEYLPNLKTVNLSGNSSLAQAQIYNLASSLGDDGYVYSDFQTLKTGSQADATVLDAGNTAQQPAGAQGMAADSTVPTAYAQGMAAPTAYVQQATNAPATQRPQATSVPVTRSPTPKPTVKATARATARPASSPTREPVTAVENLSVVGFDKSYYESGSGRIVDIKTFASLRTGPDTSYTEINRISNGEYITVYGYSNSNEWVYAGYGNQEGWIKAEYVAEYRDGMTYGDLGDYIAYGRICNVKSYASLRDRAGTNGNILRKLCNESWFFIWEYSADGKWVNVDYKGVMGWVNAKYVEEMYNYDDVYTDTGNSQDAVSTPDNGGYDAPVPTDDNSYIEDMQPDDVSGGELPDDYDIMAPDNVEPEPEITAEPVPEAMFGEQWRNDMAGEIANVITNNYAYVDSAYSSSDYDYLDSAWSYGYAADYMDEDNVMAALCDLDMDGTPELLVSYYIRGSGTEPTAAYRLSGGSLSFMGMLKGTALTINNNGGSSELIVFGNESDGDVSTTYYIDSYEVSGGYMNHTFSFAMNTTDEYNASDDNSWFCLDGDFVDMESCITMLEDSGRRGMVENVSTSGNQSINWHAMDHDADMIEQTAVAMLTEY